MQREQQSWRSLPNKRTIIIIIIIIIVKKNGIAIQFLYEIQLKLVELFGAKIILIIVYEDMKNIHTFLYQYYNNHHNTGYLLYWNILRHMLES